MGVWQLQVISLGCILVYLFDRISGLGWQNRAFLARWAPELLRVTIIRGVANERGRCCTATTGAVGVILLRADGGGGIASGCRALYHMILCCRRIDCLLSVLNASCALNILAGGGDTGASAGQRLVGGGLRVTQVVVVGVVHDEAWPVVLGSRLDGDLLRGHEAILGLPIGSVLGRAGPVDEDLLSLQRGLLEQVRWREARG